MTHVHYGVVRQNDRWVIIGENLRVGSYARRDSAVRAARRLAQTSGGLPAKLHLQDECGELLPPNEVTPPV